MFFDDFLGRRKVGQQPPISVILADKVKIMTSFGRGLRERRGAREEKEEGLLGTVDCVNKS